MKNIKISASKEYDVIIGKGLLELAGEYIKKAAPEALKAAVISDDNVAPIYLENLEKSLKKQGFETGSFVFPHGELSKTGETYLGILDFLADSGLTRSDIVVALGGGVVGDVAGFAAATYLRGTGYVQVPTSLLAMVDSSVGGKTAINLSSGKNLAGAFCQPELVLCDIDTLATLRDEHFAEGCAEVLKYAVLGDKELFAHLFKNGRSFDREYVIGRCIEMKRDYVCADEFDRGLRQKLNLGHSIGHAIEKLSDYGVSHGNAVAMGMATMARLAEKHGFCEKECANEIIKALEILDLPTESSYSAKELIEPMLRDKKRGGNRINLIIPREIGHCDIVPMELENLAQFMKTE